MGLAHRVSHPLQHFAGWALSCFFQLYKINNYFGECGGKGTDALLLPVASQEKINLYSQDKRNNPGTAGFALVYAPAHPVKKGNSDGTRLLKR